jgi:hypothetical protein
MPRRTSKQQPDPEQLQIAVRLDFTMSQSTAHRLAELQDSVHKLGHSRPTPRTLVSALIEAETRRGEKLEQELLMPFRRADPSAD